MCTPIKKSTDTSQQLFRVKKVYAFWGKFFKLYEAQDAITFLGRASFIRKRAIEKLCIKKGNTILEVACGSGRNFQYIQKMTGEHGQIIGLDYSREMLGAAEHLCKRFMWRNVILLEGDAAELNVGDIYFDGVVSVLGISAIPNWEQTLKRCKEHLRRGGRLVVCDARLFEGSLRFLNPLVAAIYQSFAAWDPTKHILEKLKELFGNIEVEWYNFETFYIATCVKE